MNARVNVTKPTTLAAALRKHYKITPAEFFAALVEELEERRAAGKRVGTATVRALVDRHFKVLGLA